MEFATKFNPHSSVGIEFNEPSMTEQHFKDECDINNIVQKYQETGVLPRGDRQPLFGDFADYPQDLMQSQQYFDKAADAFGQLPATLRKEFDNDPLKLLAFLQDDRNHEKAISLGLVDAPEHAAHPAQPASVESTIQASQQAENVQPQ